MALTATAFGDEFQIVKEKAALHFARNFGIEVEDVTVEILYPPKVAESDLAQADIRIGFDHNTARPGCQTIWLNMQDRAGNVKRYPMTVDVSISVLYPVSREKIERGELITREKIDLQKVTLYRDYVAPVAVAQLLGKVTRQVIAPGRIIREKMVREEPAIGRGEKVDIRINRASLSISVPGRILEDARIGDKVAVVLEGSGQKMSGVLTSPETVLVPIH